MVKVADRMRWGFVPAWVRFPPYLKCKIHQKLSAQKKRKRQGIDYQHAEYYVGALQKVNNAKRLEGEPVMSAPLFFRSAGREDLQFWREDDGRIMDLLLLYEKVYWNRSRSSGRKDGQFERLDGAGRD